MIKFGVDALAQGYDYGNKPEEGWVPSVDSFRTVYQEIISKLEAREEVTQVLCVSMPPMVSSSLMTAN